MLPCLVPLPSVLPPPEPEIEPLLGLEETGLCPHPPKRNKLTTSATTTAANIAIPFDRFIVPSFSPYPRLFDYSSALPLHFLRELPIATDLPNVSHPWTQR